MKHREESYMAAIALLAACLLASHGSIGGDRGSILGSYSYWLIRISAQSLIFFGVRSVIRTYFATSLSVTKITVLAILVSHLPFVLSVTAMDIVLGYPELGLDGTSDGGELRVTEFFLETLSLLDNHIALCLALSLPAWMLDTSATGQPMETGHHVGTLLSNLDPPLEGEILWVEAQEHYVRITTAHENRLLLARFSDIVRELSAKAGMQVHRSHWVASAAIAKEQRDGQKVSLLLTTGDIVPVSRSYKSQLLANRNQGDQRKL